MRTTLDLPEDLVDEARNALGYKSKTDTIIFALRQVVRDSRKEELIALIGKMEFEIDPKTLR
jgi:Arc/MetJ family transcription regulator